MYEVYLGVGVFIAGLAALFVWLDANDHNEENAVWWAFGTFLLLIIALPLYLYHRAYGSKPYRREYSTGQESRFPSHGNGRQETNIQGFGKVMCPKCNSKRTSTWPWPSAGRTEGHRCLDCKNVWNT